MRRPAPILVGDIVSSRASDHGVAIADADETLTYCQLADQARELAGRLHRDRQRRNVGLLVESSARFVKAYFAATLAGRVVVPMHPATSVPELAASAAYCEIGTFFVDEHLRGGLVAALTGAGTRQRIDVLTVAIGGGVALAETLNASAPPAPLAEDHVVGPAFDDRSVTVMLHTSGTSSRPKRVMLTHRNVLFNSAAHVAALGFGASERTLVSLPMSFGYCHTAQLLAHLRLGGSVHVLPAPFLAQGFCDAVERDEITNYTGVPTNLLLLANYGQLGDRDLSSLHTVCFGGGPAPLERVAQLAGMLPRTRFVQTYGQTEAGPRVTANTGGLTGARTRSVGTALPGVRIRIVDDGVALPAGAVGEVTVSSPGVMRGYFKRHGETTCALRDGWLRTGDLGWIDGDGYLYIVGRTRNVIISGGFNIYPEEIEEVLLAHPEVAEAVVLGQPDGLLGEVPVARVVASGLERTEDLHGLDGFSGLGRAPRHELARTLTGHCTARLAGYKVPRAIEVVAALPKTATGKPRRGAGAGMRVQAVSTRVWFDASGGLIPQIDPFHLRDRERRALPVAPPWPPAHRWCDRCLTCRLARNGAQE